ncbi:MAG: penicillin-binding protein [Patescibacteria group bacterium]|nr:penicillin-binding protein [Patescibacteria group bacterium]
MPIPQLSRKTKSPQVWRDKSRGKGLTRSKKKKYYLSGANYKNKRRGNHPPAGGTKWLKKINIGFAKKTKNNLLKILIGKSVNILIVLIILSGLFGCATVAWLSRGLPNPNRLIERQIAQSTKIYDRTGEDILYEIHGDQKRTLVNLDEIPNYLKNATVTIEDKNFYKHGGFSFWAIFRTAVTNIIRRRKAGGSTLTQQFIKNAVLSPEKTYTRKIKELILAYRMEKKFSKDEILQMYLNEIPYGSTAYGVEAASRRYFNKSVKDINLAEAAVLAAMPQAPSRYSPYGTNKNLLIDRQHYILDLMVKQNYITENEADIAKEEKLEFKEPSDQIIAPHFVMFIKEMLSEKYGEKMIEQEGLKIYTTLDLYKQKIAEKVIDEIAEKNENNYNASNAALISIDPKTGQILAMVGSRDYFNDKIDGQVNVTLQPRQPGSSFKPIVYASAFIKGYTPNTVLYDVVTDFSNDPDNPYEPHNYDDQEHGPVTIKKALAGSLNIPAVKTIYLAGIDNVLDLAESLGYTTLTDRSRFGLSLVLGGGEVKLIEHVNAYSAFAREGELHPIAAILKIEDKNGKIIEEFDPRHLNARNNALDAKIARLINNILSDNAARAFAFGENNWLTLGSRPIAAKTGTTNDYRDAWTIGYTPSIVTGVWVGNNNNSPMKRGAAGGTVAAPIWHNYMKRVLGNTPIEYFKEPEEIKTGKPMLDGETNGTIKIKIDKSSGLLATEHTPNHLIEEKTFSQHHSVLYYLNKDDPRGGPRENPGKDPQFELWESRVLAWAESQEDLTVNKPPTEYDNLHKQENQPTFLIESLTNNQTIMEPLLTININASAPRGINRAEYYINDNLLASINSYPFNLSQPISFLSNGFHKLKVRVCDDVDNCSEKSLDFNLITDETPAIDDITVSWLEPSSGLAAANIDFPLTLKVNAGNPDQTAKINFYYLTKDNNNPQYITTLQPIKASPAFTQWANAPEAGAYKLYAEAYGWNGQFAKSEELVITVVSISADGAEE